MRRFQFGLFAIALLVVTSCAYAITTTNYTISPSNLQGWSAVSDNGGTGQFANFGVAIDDGVGFLTDHNGAWYAQCGYEGDDGAKTPSTVWLGVDQIGGISLAGKPLSSVSYLWYQTYISKQSTIIDPNGPKWPMQPIQLQITVTKDGVNRRQIYHRPYGIRGENTGGNYVGRWNWFNAYLCDSPTDEWVLDNDQATEYQTFQAIPQTWMFAATSTWWSTNTDRVHEVPQIGYKSVGWDADSTPPGDPTSTGTGMPLNFIVGARKSVTNVWNFSGWAWWRESVGFKGYVDDFKIILDGNQYNFNFESDAAPLQVVALNNKAAYDSICYLGRIPSMFRFKVFGIVLADPAPTGAGFWLDDGTGQPIHVIVTDAGAVAGQYWSAIGRLYTPFDIHATNKELYSNSGDCFQLE